MTRTVKMAEKVAASPNNNGGDKAAEAISLEFNCEQCDEHFESVNELKTHEGKVHSVIPQMDGQYEELFEENEGKDAFKCLRCKLFYLPMSHIYGNPIVEFKTCKKHIGIKNARFRA